MIRDSLKSEKTYQIIPGIVYCQKWMKNQYIIFRIELFSQPYNEN